jgi:predicted peptidase
MLLLALLVLDGESSFSQESQPFQESVLSKTITRQLSLRYLIHVPKKYGTRNSAYPLLLYLHGGLGRGNDFQKLSWYPIPKMIRENSFPDSFIVVIPQCPEGQMWTEQLDALLSLIEETAKRYSIDTTRIYGMGYSMGANGIGYLAYVRPKIFSAIALMSGVYNPWWVTRLRNVPAWYFHGAKDTCVSVNQSDRMVEEYRKEGMMARYSRDPEGGHRPPSTEAHREVLDWLLQFSKDR